MMRLCSRHGAALLALCAVAVAAGALAQSPQTAQPAMADMSGSYRIAGVLVNASTGEPVQRATVEALKEEDSHAVATCVTNSEGRFVLDRLAAAKYQLTASKRGFRTAFYDEHDQFSTAIVTGPDQDTSHLRFKLTPLATLHGVVTSDAGDPVANARVTLFRRPKHPGAGERIEPADGTSTDDTGAYEFSDVAAGEYLLAVMAEPWYAVHDGAPGKRNAALDVAYPVTYFDSTTDEASATPIVLAGGSREEANISLHAVPALHLSIPTPRKADGTIVMPLVQQMAFGNVINAESAGNIGGIETGALEVSGIAPGRYEVTQFDPPRVVDLDLASSQQVDPTAGSPANAVAGRIRMLSGAPAPDNATVSLHRVDNGPGQFTYAALATHGRFKFDAVPPGEWAVAATSGSSALTVVAVGTDAAQQAGNIVTLRDHAPELLVTLSDFETNVEGFAMKSGKGLAGAMIVLLPENPAQWRTLTRRDQSDSDGSFALRDVSPGEYKLVAIEDGWDLDWTSPEAMARYLQHGAKVRVTESSGKLVRLGTPVVVQQR
jgi:5-hydroxyisourate hydrolase-like protein (transthyretin family)